MAAVIRAVTFDVWETLLHDQPELEPKQVVRRAEDMARVLERHGVSTRPEAFARA